MVSDKKGNLLIQTLLSERKKSDVFTLNPKWKPSLREMKEAGVTELQTERGLISVWFMWREEAESLNVKRPKQQTATFSSLCK